MLSKMLGAFSGILTLAGIALAANTITVSSTSSHAIPTTLYGQMYEDISHSGDGGLYAELLQNRAFQQQTAGTSAALAAWSAVGGASISVIDTDPLSAALPNTLEVSIPSGTSGAAGFSNSGYFGIKVDSSWTYNASFYYKFPTASSFSGFATVTLQSTSGTVYASATIPLRGSQTTYKQVFALLRSRSSPSATTNVFTVTVSGASGQTIHFGLFSLMPPTYKNRVNGLRIDIATALADAKPGVWRFPGGNNLEGQTFAERWQWNNTVGPLIDRPGRVGDWGYINTDGFGLLEHLYWAEDAGAVPIMAVWSGYSLNTESVAEDDLSPYIQQAIDQINFVVGKAADSAPAALRASLGHEEPFALTYVEVGNEDFFAASTYTYRWQDFVDELQATFPDLIFLATSDVGSPVLTPTPAVYDVHVYQTPDWFAENAFIWDSFTRDGQKYFQGEYAAVSTNASNVFGTPDQGRLTYPTIQSSVGEAAYMTGFERNADIVFAAAYAPLLGDVNSFAWTPNLVNFDAGNVYLSTSYYVQKLFSLSKGDVYIPSTLPSANGTAFWSVTRATSQKLLYIKAVNYAAASDEFTFVLPFSVSSRATVQVLTGSETASNTQSTPNAVGVTTNTISVRSTFTYNAPAWSFSVITLTL